MRLRNDCVRLVRLVRVYKSSVCLGIPRLHNGRTGRTSGQDPILCGFLRVLAVHAQRPPEALHGVAVHLVADGCAAGLALVGVLCVALGRGGLALVDGTGTAVIDLHALICPRISFRIVAGGDGEAQEVGVFDGCGFRFHHGLVTDILPRADAVDGAGVTRFRIREFDCHRDRGQVLGRAARIGDILHAHEFGMRGRGDAVLHEGFVHALEHVCARGVTVAMIGVRPVFLDMGALLHDFGEFLSQLFHRDHVPLLLHIQSARHSRTGISFRASTRCNCISSAGCSFPSNLARRTLCA